MQSQKSLDKQRRREEREERIHSGREQMLRDKLHTSESSLRSLRRQYEAATSSSFSLSNANAVLTRENAQLRAQAAVALRRPSSTDAHALQAVVAENTALLQKLAKARKVKVTRAILRKAFVAERATCSSFRTNCHSSGSNCDCCYQAAALFATYSLL